MDIKDLNKEVKSLERGGNRNPDVIYFEDDKDTQVRLVPMDMSDVPEMNNVADQFVRAQVHYRSGNVVPKTGFSPETFGQQDPIQDFISMILNKKRVSKKRFVQLMQMKPSNVYITTAVVRGNEDQGTKLLVFSEGQFKQFRENLILAFKPDNPEDITDVKDGYDLTFSVTSKENSDTNMRKFNITVNVRKSTPLADDDKKIKELVGNQPAWTNAYPKYTPEDISDYIDAMVEESEEDENFDDGYSEPTEYTPSSKDDIDDEEIINQASAQLDAMASENEADDELPDADGVDEEELVAEGEGDDDDDVPF